MSTRSAILFGSLLISTTSLIIGHTISGKWLGLLVILLAWFIWFVFKKRSVFWSASGAFILYIFAAGFGIYSNLSLPLMVTGGFSALIGWDLLIFDYSQTSPKTNIPADSLERSHLRSLGLAILGGVVTAFGAASLNFQLTFSTMIIFVLLSAGFFILGVQNFLRGE